MLIHFFMSTNPFSTDYKSPLQSSKYFKMQDEGAYLLRIITPKEQVVSYFSEFIDTYEGKKKVNAPDKGDGVIPIGESEQGFKLRWAVSVLNQETKQVQVWEITQVSIRDFLFAIAKGKIKNDWTKFDIQVTKKGQKMETTYTLIAGDTSPLSKEDQAIIAETPVNLEALVEGKDPFEVVEEKPKADTQKADEDLPSVDEVLANVPF
jgi:hypothetical protein